MNPWWKMGIVIAWTLTAIFIGWHFKTIYMGYKETNELIAEKKQHLLDLKKDHNDQITLEDNLKKERQKNLTLTQKVRDEDAKVKNNCPVPAALIRLRNKAIAP